MSTGTQSRRGQPAETEPTQRPEIATCESSPGKTVFLESGNTDGWISSDVTVDVRQ
ncbi:hypothetical protein [Haloferax elongans]|uniref:hypothetical protein n=1 Tax=Haloferax elongans TaxID=403191 RepID=UPI000ABCD593|nr:hypothetical protein [Haloferax elongans]